MKATRAVPCGACTLCCQNGEAIILHLEDGDIPAFYKTETIIHPLNGTAVFMLKQKPDRSCLYLGETGCTIYERRPAICREFDCRRYAKKVNELIRKRVLPDAAVSGEVIARGKELMGTL